MGYDAPDGFSDTRVANPDLARAGGDLLAADVNGQWDHSPGPSTARDGDRALLRVDDGGGRVRRLRYARQRRGPVGLSGNGFGQKRGRLPPRRRQRVCRFRVDGSGQLHRHGTGVCARLPEPQAGLSGRADAGLGLDPAGDQFGSIRFDAEVVGRDGLDTRDHSHYYDMGSESLRAMTYIATGESDECDEGLLADGRRQPQSDLPTEIDLPFGGKIDLPPVGFDVPGSPAYIDPEAGRPRSQ